MSSPEARRRLPLPDFTAMRYPAYRWWWLSSSTVMLNQFMTMLSISWLVLELTDSVRWVSFAVFAFGLPAFLFLLPAGVLADRWDRRKLLMVTQVVAVANVLILAIVVSADLISPELTLFFAAVSGSTVAVSQPARQSMIPLLLPAELRLNGIVLGSLSQNLSQLIGPAIAGFLIATVAISAAFYALAVLLSVGVIALMFLRLPPKDPSEDAPARRFQPKELCVGFTVLWSNRPLLVLTGLYLATGIWVGGSIQTLLPVLVRDEYNVGASALGLAFTIQAIGAIVTSLWITRLGGVRNKGGFFACGMLLGSSSLAAYSMAPTFEVALLFFFTFGCATAFYTNFSQSLLQVHTPQILLGRVLSIITLSISGFIPLGALQAGLVASLLDPRTAGLYGGVTAFVLALLALTRAHSFRRLS